MPHRDQLVFKALCVLDEAIDQARRGTAPASLGLRFALAYLYAAGDRRREWFDREPYDEFWRLATQNDRVGGTVEATARLTMMYVSLQSIARAAGAEITPPIMERLSEARRVGPRAPHPL